MAEDDLIYFAAAILLARMVGESQEPAGERQIQIAVSNAETLHEAVKKRREQIRATQPFGHG